MKLCTWLVKCISSSLSFYHVLFMCHKYKRNGIKPGKTLTTKYFIAEYNPSALLLTVSGCTRHRNRPSRRCRHDKNMVRLSNFEYALCLVQRLVNHKMNFRSLWTQRHLSWKCTSLNPFFLQSPPLQFFLWPPPPLLIFRWPSLSFLFHSSSLFPEPLFFPSRSRSCDLTVFTNLRL